jgi:RNA polymerase sigma factor (sigma-70 family)
MSGVGATSAAVLCSCLRNQDMRWVTTSWTQVLAARDAPTEASCLALEQLCQVYWYPLYVFVRRQGIDAEDARDVTQAYFAQLLEKGYLEDCDPERGRFRVFLMTSVRNFLSKEREKSRTWKRGGRTEIVPLDVDPEGRYREEPADRLTPEAVFERRWALTLLERVLARLRQEHAAAGRAREFERLKPFLTGDEPQAPYREVARDLGISEAAVKTAVHRLRQRFGVALREAIAETVADPADVDDEVRHLLGVLAPWRAPAG